jgi:multiple sugar transport system permease protein
LFVSPWLVGFVAFGLYPMVMSILLAFTNYSILQPGRTEFTGLVNVTRLLNDSLFWKAMGNTGFMTLFGVPVSVVLALAIALPLNVNMRGINLYRTLVYLPVLVPPMVVVLLFLWILNPNYGLLKVPFDLVGIPSPGWLADPIWAKPAILIMVMWNTIGQVMIITLAGLRDVPKQLYEAASIDGAGNWDQFFFITLPGLSPVIFYNVLTGVLFFVQIFTQAFASSVGVTGGGGTGGNIGAPVNSTLMISLHIYKLAFISSQAGYASLISVVVLIISVVLALVFFRFARQYVHYEFAGDQR